MFGWVEWSLLTLAAAFLVCAAIPKLRAYRPLFLGGFVLLLSTTLFRRRSDLFGKALASGGAGTVELPVELFGIAWWILGAWLVRSLLTLVLSRTLFPDDNQPHARRLFADLGSGLIYVIALAGIMETVIKQPISAVLATSGVLAIVLGFALQSTLGDVLSGLSINIEKSFGAGDWISLKDHVDGQVIEINWRATRIKTYANDLVIVPNSVIAKAVVTNHRSLYDPFLCALRVTVDNTVPPAAVIELLRAAAAEAPGIAPTYAPVALAHEFVGSLIAYDVFFGVVEFARADAVKSDVILRIVEACTQRRIRIGAETMDVRMVPEAAREAH